MPRRPKPLPPVIEIAGEPVTAKRIAAEAETMKRELEDHSLKVVLVPAQSAIGALEISEARRKIRVAEDQNPKWYQVLYSRVAGLRRDRVQKALDLIIEERDATADTQRLIDIIEDRLSRGYEEPDQRQFIPPVVGPDAQYFKDLSEGTDIIAQLAGGYATEDFNILSEEEAARRELAEEERAEDGEDNDALDFLFGEELEQQIEERERFKRKAEEKSIPTLSIDRAVMERFSRRAG